MKDFSRFKQIESVAYAGSTGKIREQFCIDYIAHKKKVIPLMEESLSQEVMLNYESITCSRGCATCCSSFIVASLQECEAIVYWLYQHPDILSRFLMNYGKWEKRASQIEPVVQIINPPTRTTPEDSELKNAMDDYRRERIPCPFLDDGSCSIYEVRPWACAGVISVSLKEWCDISHPDWNKLKTYRFGTYAMFEKQFYVKLKKAVPLGCLPEMVYRILAEGNNALAGYQSPE